MAAIGLLSACPLPWKDDLWTAKEVQEWHATWGAATESKPESPLFYRGSDAEHHYFSCRPIDSWVLMKVSREQIEIDDEQPYVGSGPFRSGPFPGYYTVDPSDGFKRIG